MTEESVTNVHKAEVDAGPSQPAIHEAELAHGQSGGVIRGLPISFAAAVIRRKQGQNVVVCGDILKTNRGAAQQIEASVGPYLRSLPHKHQAGARALPHFQQQDQDIEGHTFYETGTQKAEETAMKYFTRDRYLGLQTSNDDAMDAADAAWQAAVAAYDTRLQGLRAILPEGVLGLLEDYYFPGARVLSLGQRGEFFVVTLQLDVPPHDLLTITYALSGPPAVKRDNFAWVTKGHAMSWLCDEIEMVGDETRPHFVHSILLSSGWEIDVPFHSVQTTTATAILPHPRSVGMGEPPVPAPQSA